MDYPPVLSITYEGVRRGLNGYRVASNYLPYAHFAPCSGHNGVTGKVSSRSPRGPRLTERNIVKKLPFFALFWGISHARPVTFISSIQLNKPLLCLENPVPLHLERIGRSQRYAAIRKRPFGYR